MHNFLVNRTFLTEYVPMYESHHLSLVAKLISDPSRAIMLSLLSDGRARTASELSVVADITPQTASAHLVRLLEGKLLAVEKLGRHRYYRLANREVGDMLESMLVFSQGITDHKEFGPRDQSLHFARSCYDHLAGELAVKIFDELELSKVIVKTDDRYVVADDRHPIFSDLHINLEEVKKRKRPFIRTCLDWRERRHHLAGSLGSAILEGLIDEQWLKREQKDRVLTLTAEGRIGLNSWLPNI